MGFILKNNGNIPYYIIEEFENTGLVKHCFSTKHGGVSSGIFKSMNLKFGIGDSDENVRENYKLLCSAAGINYESLVLPEQVHSDNIKIVGKEDMGKGIISESDIRNTDALITDLPGVTLVCGYADCVPVYLLDTKRRAIGLVHSGWKGTVLEISAKTVMAMHEQFGCNPYDITAAIGPSIGVCHFEIGDDTAEKFRSVFGESVLLKKEKYHADMQKAITLSLQKAGVENIIFSGICTYCHSDDLFSHRKTKGKRGGLAAFLQLRAYP